MSADSTCINSRVNRLLTADQIVGNIIRSNTSIIGQLKTSEFTADSIETTEINAQNLLGALLSTNRIDHYDGFSGELGESCIVRVWNQVSVGVTLDLLTITNLSPGYLVFEMSFLAGQISQVPGYWAQNGNRYIVHVNSDGSIDPQPSLPQDFELVKVSEKTLVLRYTWDPHPGNAGADNAVAKITSRIHVINHCPGSEVN